MVGFELNSMFYLLIWYGWAGGFEILPPKTLCRREILLYLFVTELSICGMLGKLGCQCTVGYDITIGFSKKHSLTSKWYFPTITIPLWIQNSYFHENWNIYFLSNLHLQIFIHWGCRHQTDTWYNTRKTFCGLFLVQTVSYGKLGIHSIGKNSVSILF